MIFPPLLPPVGADHHYVYLCQFEWVGGAGLPLRSQGSYHPVPATEECQHPQGGHHPLQCYHWPRLQFLSRYQLKDNINETYDKKNCNYTLHILYQFKYEATFLSHCCICTTHGSNQANKNIFDSLSGVLLFCCYFHQIIKRTRTEAQTTRFHFISCKLLLDYNTANLSVSTHSSGMYTLTVQWKRNG